MHTALPLPSAALFLSVSRQLKAPRSMLQVFLPFFFFIASPGVHKHFLTCRLILPWGF